jgi:ubiquinone/menaquinone biosynthesis C-methylase UbiE
VDYLGVESVKFDRAVEYYDVTRALEPGVMREVVKAHASELENNGPTLEIGVGTGRFALPLDEAGIEMVGLDLSRPMMRKLLEKAGGKIPFPLVEGDATKLPFATDSFGSALVVHVFHLIPNWPDALRELLRVVRSSGRLITDFGDKGDGQWDEIYKVFAAAAKIPETNVGVTEPDDVRAAILETGARELPVQEFSEVKTRSYREIIDWLERGLFSATWRTDDQGRKAGADAARAWLAEKGLTEADNFETERRLLWRLYELP